MTGTNQSGMTWLIFALMTVAAWGLYGVFLHKGQVQMEDPVNGRYKAFLFVGIAYFLTAVLAPLALLLAIMLTCILAVELALHIRVIGIVLVVIPAISLVWLWLQSEARGAFAARLRDYALVELNGYKHEILLLMSAGYIGITASALLGPWMAAAEIDLTADELAEAGYKMVIWPVSSLRVANKAQEKLYQIIARDGSTRAARDDMQTRAELYETIDLAGFEALDRNIVATVLPTPADA